MFDRGYYAVQTLGSGGCQEWSASTHRIYAEQEAMRLWNTLPFLLPVRVWIVRPIKDGVHRRIINGPWEFPTMDEEYGPDIRNNSSQ